ncbi:MAG: hypothetical protein ACHREM_00485 [Polyangiales bacterium]
MVASDVVTEDQRRASAMLDSLEPLWLLVLFTRDILERDGFVCNEELCGLAPDGDVYVAARYREDPGNHPFRICVGKWRHEPDDFIVDRAATRELADRASPAARAVGFGRATRCRGLGPVFDQVNLACFFVGIPALWPLLGPCLDCGAGTVRGVRRPGRVRRARGGAEMEIPADVSIPTCQSCGVETVDAATAERLAALDASAVPAVPAVPEPVRNLGVPMVPEPVPMTAMAVTNTSGTVQSRPLKQQRNAAIQNAMSANTAEWLVKKLPAPLVKAFVCREMVLSLGFEWGEVDIVTMNDREVGISILRPPTTCTMSTGTLPAEPSAGSTLDRTIFDGYRAWMYASAAFRERCWFDHGGVDLLHAIELAMRGVGLEPGPPPPHRLN